VILEEYVISLLCSNGVLYSEGIETFTLNLKICLLTASAKFEKYCLKGYAYRGYGLPDLKVGDYYYTPTSLEPPITREEFKHLYQNAARRQRLHWRATLPFYHSDLDNLSTDTVDRIPQRFWNFNKRRNDREDFWGIYVRERRSAMITTFYILLCLAPFMVFCVLYLFGFVQADFQNATTPLALSLTALSLYFGSMIKK
jgi:hypothetical protein